MTEEQKKNFDTVVMKKYMNWYIPHRDEVFKATTALEKLYGIIYNEATCIEQYEYSQECFGKMALAVVHFFEAF